MECISTEQGGTVANADVYQSNGIVRVVESHVLPNGCFRFSRYFSSRK
jgi:hypothetical protein